MLARLRAWWAGRSGIERLLVAVGVPVAAVAALWGARQDRARKAAAAEDAEGGPGTEATTTVAARGPSVINTGAPGVDTSQLASFTEAFTGELGSLEQSQAQLEEQFGATSAERAKADAERQAQFSDLQERFEGVQRAATKAGTRATQAEKIARKAQEEAELAAERERTRNEFIALFGVAPSENESTARWKRRIKAGRENVANGLTPTGQPK